MIRVGENSVHVQMSHDLKQQKKMEHTKEEGRKNQGNSYFHQFDFDIEYVNYIRETVPKTVHKVSYFQELCGKSAAYLNSIRKGQKDCGFNDFAAADAYSYFEMYKSIVEGYRSGTRKLYVCDDPVSGERRLMTLEEELEKLNKGFEELITWNKANARVAQSQMYIAERQKREKWNESFEAYDSGQICDYIQDTYTEFRSRFQQEYEKNGENVDIKAIIYSIMQGGHQGIHDYCKWLFWGNGIAG